MKVKIYYEDTDCGGIVYHANYLKYTERARSEYLSRFCTQAFMSNQGFVVRDLECRFFAPAKLLDELEIKSNLLAIKSASIKIEQKIFRQNELLFSQKTTLAFMKDKKLSLMDEDLIKSLKQINQDF